MAEVDTKTAEQKLLDDAKNSTGGGSSAASGSTDDSTLTPEQKLISEMRGKLEESEKRAKKAEEERDYERIQKDSAQNTAKTEVERRVKTQEDAVTTNLVAAKSTFESARKEFKDAHDSGDTSKILDAQTTLNDAQMRLRGAEYAEAQFKQNKDRVVSGTSRFTKVEQEWIDKNPRFNSDRRFRAAVYAADEEARSKNIQIDSREYFNHIETYIRDVGLEDDDGDTQQQKPADKKETQRRSDKQTTAAPAGGASGQSGASGGSKKTFTMTPEHRRGAQISFPEEYRKDPAKAEEKYAKYQLQLQDKKAKGER